MNYTLHFRNSHNIDHHILILGETLIKQVKSPLFSYEQRYYKKTESQKTHCENGFFSYLPLQYLNLYYVHYRIYLLFLIVLQIFQCRKFYIQTHKTKKVVDYSHRHHNQEWFFLKNWHYNIFKNYIAETQI